MFVHTGKINASENQRKLHKSTLAIWGIHNTEHWAPSEFEKLAQLRLLIFQ